VSILNRRQFLAASIGVAGAVTTGTWMIGSAWPQLASEDLVPGEAPDVVLQAQAWSTTSDRVTFAVVGDNGSGGRQAMAVAERMAHTYARTPYGFVAHLGDICYYGNFEDRFEDVFTRPMKPLIDAGVQFELALGNHDPDLDHSDEGLEEIEAELRLLGTPSTYYTTSHGPVDLFYLDSSVPGLFGPSSSQQLEWLEDALASSTNQWKIVALHHPLYSSGRHGSTRGAEARLAPLLARHHVDLVLSGHDHHYERTHPLDGVTYVVSGGGCKTTAVGSSDFTAAAASTLQFLLVDVQDDQLTVDSIRPDGSTVDTFVLRAREGR
jgi:3',5'-cyclic AMP phosphodiesterase CpdA